MFLLKIHSSYGKSICAVCDSEILGKVFEERGVFLDVDQNFFKGEESDLKKIIESIHNAPTSNIIGNRIVSELVKIGAVKESHVKEVSGMKYLMIFKINDL